MIKSVKTDLIALVILFLLSFWAYKIDLDIITGRVFLVLSIPILIKFIIDTKILKLKS